MTKIKFSHHYLKFPLKPPFKAKLLQVIIVNGNLLTKDFLDYDTEYFGDKLTTKHYELPKSCIYLLLLLKTDDGQLFTTIRSYKQGKYVYYSELQGEVFDIVVEEKK